MDGSVTLIVPPVVALTAALILVGEVKLPDASESCTVNVLPEKKLQLEMLLVTLKVDAAHLVLRPVGVLMAGELMVKAAEAVPVTAGLLETTRIR